MQRRSFVHGAGLAGVLAAGAAPGFGSSAWVSDWVADLIFRPLHWPWNVALVHLGSGPVQG